MLLVASSILNRQASRVTRDGEALWESAGVADVFLFPGQLL